MKICMLFNHLTIKKKKKLKSKYARLHAKTKQSRCFDSLYVSNKMT